MTRLLILWLLAEGPLHGYRVRKILADPALAFWFQIEDGSIYSMLRGLAKHGFARIEGEEREGLRPSRIVYRITRAGRRELRRRLEEAWRHPEPRKEAFTAGLAAADELEAGEIRSLLRARRQALAQRRIQLEAVARSAPSALLARREAALVDAEISWLERETRSRGAKPKKGVRP